MTNSLSTIPINRLNSNELNEKINTSVEEKANVDLSNTPFANLENVDGTLTWGGNEVLASNNISNTELSYLDGVTSNIQTQLNGKQASGSYANTSASNFNTTGKSTIVGWGMPAYNRAISIATQASGSTYTAQVTGWVKIIGTSNGNRLATLDCYNNTSGFGVTDHVGEYADQYKTIRCMLLVSKGNTYTVTYWNGGITSITEIPFVGA